MDWIIVCSTNYLPAFPNYGLCTVVVDNRIELTDGVRVWDLVAAIAKLAKYPSAVVSVITKSGTNKFPGSLLKFFRDRNLR